MKLSIKKIILIIFVSFLVAREFAPFHLSYYKSNWNSSANSRSNCSKAQYGDIPTYINTVDFDETEEVDIIYNGLEEHTETSSSSENIVVRVNAPDISSWKYYIPFYKNVSFNYNFNYTINTRIKFNQETTSVSCHGSVGISGSHKLVGICSGKTAQQEIREKIHSSVKTAIGGKIQDQIDEIVEASESQMISDEE